MFKKILFKAAALTAAVICMASLTSCIFDTEKESTETETKAEKKKRPTSASTEAEPSETETAPAPTEAGTAAASSEITGSRIAKIKGDADKAGICSVVILLTDQAADKGVIEMVYLGEQGSPQEKSVVNTFRIEYYRESAGTFEIKTFSDGEIYQNQNHKDKVQVTHTFGAALRAGHVTISYTPDGGEKQVIFSAGPEYFNPSGK